MLLAALASEPAIAQMPVLRGVTGVQVEYKEPINPAHKPIYERLKNRAGSWSSTRSSCRR